MTKIGFIGTGVMGKSIAFNLMKEGHHLFVYNRTKEKTDELVKEGATYCENPLQVAENADIIFSMVGYPKDVEEIYLGENGAFQTKIDGKIFVDMTTSEPQLAVTLFEKAKELSAHMLDAPVSGGDIGAKNGTMTIMVGGEKEIFDEVSPYFEIIGKTINYMGNAGSGQHTKMANQIGIAGTMTALSEILVYAKAANLNLEDVIAVLSGGGASTWSLTNYAPRILKQDYSPGFFVKHFIKDLGIALAEAEKMSIPLPATKRAKELYDLLAKNGCENDGTQSLIKLWWEFEEKFE